MKPDRGLPSSSVNKSDDSVIWSSKSPPFQLMRPLNFREDTVFPGVSFRQHHVSGETLTLRQYHDVEVLWYNYGIYVLDSKGEPIRSLCYLFGNAPPIEQLRVDEPMMLDGVTASIMHWVPGNYCHILAEHIPLLHALEEAKQLGRVDYILCDKWASKLLADVRAIYTTKADFIGVETVGHVRCKTLLAFEPVRHPGHWGHEVMQRFFDKVRDKAQPTKPHRRLIITRPLGHRGFSNQSDLTAALPNFEVLDLEKPMSLYDQARLFAEAEIVVCGHGAALTNLVFMQPGTGVVEIFNYNYGLASFWILAGARDIRYCATIDVRGPRKFDDYGKKSDILVDIPAVVESVGIIDGNN